MRSRHGPCPSAPDWNCTGSLPVPALADLFISLNRLSRVLFLSMGFPASGDRFSGNFFRPACLGAMACPLASAFTADGLVAALAALPTDVRVRPRQIVERRSDLEKTDGLEIPLRNPAIANLDWLVCPSVARLAPANFHLPLARG